jgi:hypothetical protein
MRPGQQALVLPVSWAVFGMQKKPKRRIATPFQDVVPRKREISELRSALRACRKNMLCGLRDGREHLLHFGKTPNLYILSSD